MRPRPIRVARASPAARRPLRMASTLCTMGISTLYFRARRRAAGRALMPSTTWPTSALASSAVLPRPSSMPACRLRLCMLVQVTIRSPMPERPENVSARQPMAAPRRASSALPRVMGAALALSP